MAGEHRQTSVRQFGGRPTSFGRRTTKAHCHQAGPESPGVGKADNGQKRSFLSNAHQRHPCPCDEESELKVKRDEKLQHAHRELSNAVHTLTGRKEWTMPSASCPTKDLFPSERCALPTGRGC